YRLAHYPLLHSFPTRRSSDLRSSPKRCWTCARNGSPSGPCDGAVRLASWLGFSVNLTARPIWFRLCPPRRTRIRLRGSNVERYRSEEHTSELQSRVDLVCRLL